MKKLPVYSPVTSALALPSVVGSVATYLGEREVTKRVLAEAERDVRIHAATMDALEALSRDATLETALICQTIVTTDDVETKRRLAAALCNRRAREVDDATEIAGHADRARRVRRR